mmetsp:Transcript_29894/g.46876  ORF Transcript_29894/g.46876 Transcript_29894/m.46876 type:complete len:221 (-) Transcript_29894:591-1253(-)
MTADELEESTTSSLLGLKALIAPSDAIDGQGQDCERAHGYIIKFYPKFYPRGAFRIEFENNTSGIFYPEKAYRASAQARKAQELEAVEVPEAKRSKTSNPYGNASLEAEDEEVIAGELRSDYEQKEYLWQRTNHPLIGTKCWFDPDSVPSGVASGEAIVAAWLPQGEEEEDFEMFKVYFPSNKMSSDYGGPDSEVQNRSQLDQACQAWKSTASQASTPQP